MDADSILIEPLLTEKSNLMREKNKYAFKVDPRANKIQIMQAVRELFNVNPVGCNIMKITGKPKRVRYRPGYTATWKKAIVTLSEGEKLDIFEGV
jgi:large subunit ribosomal protein L23